MYRPSPSKTRCGLSVGRKLRSLVSVNGVGVTLRTVGVTGLKPTPKSLGCPGMSLDALGLLFGYFYSRILFKETSAGLLGHLVGPADRNRTCICRLGGGRSIH